MAFADAFAEGVTSGLQTGLRQYNLAQEEKRRKAEEERRVAEYEELQRQRAAERQYQSDLGELIQARSLGMPDYQATAQAASNRIAAGGENYDEPRFARGLTPTVRGESLTNTQFARQLADLQLGAGKIDAGGYLNMQELARRGEARDIRDATVKAFKENPDMVVGDWAKRFNPMESGLPVIVGKREKDGFVTLSMVDPDSPEAEGINIRMSPAQQLKVAQGVALMEGGFSDEAMELLDSVDERLGKLALTFNQTQATLAGNANDVAGARGLQAYRDATLANDAERIKIARAEANRPRGGPESRGAQVQLVNPANGQIALAYTNELPKDANGLRAPPAGWKFATQRPELSANDRIARITAVYEQLAANPPTEVVNGKEAPVSQDKLWSLAAQQVDRMLGQGAPAEQGGLSPEVVQRMLELQAARTQGRNQPTQSTPVSTGQTVFGPLTPRSLVEAEARAGNPAAIRYLQQLQANQEELIRSRATGLPMAAP